jgi:hypothetical protein
MSENNVHNATEQFAIASIAIASIAIASISTTPIRVMIQFNFKNFV